MLSNLIANHLPPLNIRSAISPGIARGGDGELAKFFAIANSFTIRAYQQSFFGHITLKYFGDGH